MIKYKLYYRGMNRDLAAMRFNLDGSVTSFIFNPENTDYKEYLAWLAEGNEPLPADEPETP